LFTMKNSLHQDAQQTSSSKPALRQRNRRPDPPAAGGGIKEIATVADAHPWSCAEFSTSSLDHHEQHQQQWRQYGHTRRQWLLENDTATTSFRMNAACSIDKYFALAERVRRFMALDISPGTKINVGRVLTHFVFCCYCETAVVTTGHCTISGFM
jgi:hypothetical protein